MLYREAFGLDVADAAQKAEFSLPHALPEIFAAGAKALAGTPPAAVATPPAAESTETAQEEQPEEDIGAQMERKRNVSNCHRRAPLTLPCPCCRP